MEKLIINLCASTDSFGAFAENAEGVFLERDSLSDELKRDINRYGKGENGSSGDFFYLKCSGDSYKVYYLNLNGEEEEIGDLQIKQEL